MSTPAGTTERPPGRAAPWRLRAATGWRSVTGAAPAASAAFALLVLGAVFLATAGPRQSVAMRTAALHRDLAAVPAVQRSVQLTSFPWQLVQALPDAQRLPGGPGPLVASHTDLATLTAEAAQALAATPLPLAGRAADWTRMDTARAPVSGAAARAFLRGSPPEMEVVYADPLARHAQLVTGRYPRTAGLRFSGGALAGATFEVAVTQATADRFGLHPGSRLTGAGSAVPVTLVVTAVLRPVRPGSAFWTADPATAAPVRVPPQSPGALPFWSAVALTGPAELPAMQAVFTDSKSLFSWDFPLSTSRVAADQAATLAAQLNRVASRSLELSGPFSGAASALAVAIAGPQPVLAGFLAAQRAVQAVLALLFTGLALIDLVAVLLAAQLAAARRAGEHALLQARGAALRQLAALAFRHGAVFVVPAAAAGAGLALLATPDGGNPPLAWWLSGIAAAAALAGLPLAVVRQQWVASASPAGSRSLDRAAARRAPLRRWVAEVSLTAAAAGGLILLRDQGLAAGPGLDLYPAAAPALAAVPAALLVLRLYPLLLRSVLRLSARRAPVTWFIALARGARAGTFTALPMFALVLALVLACFAGMVRSAVDRGENAASWQQVGADAVVKAGPGTTGLSPVVVRALTGDPGVAHASALRVMTWAPGYQAPIQLAAVPPSGYAAFTAATPWPRLAGSRLAAGGERGGLVPALAGPGARGALGAGPVVIDADGESLTIRVVGTLPATPAFPGVRSFLVLPMSAVRGPYGPLPPNELLLAGPDLDLARLTATVHRLVPGATIISRRAVLDSLAAAPLQHGSYQLYAAGLAAAAALSALVLLLALALSAPGRELTLTRLATMGLAARQARLAALAEALPAVLAAALAGAAGAVILAAELGPAIDLSVFTGSAAPVPLRPGFAALAGPAAGLVVLGLATLTAEVATARRRGVARALRLGE